MRSAASLPAVVVALALLDPGPCLAQTSSPLRHAPAAPGDAEGSHATPLRSRVFSAVGGAVLGAGLGFFASQVATGDWDEAAGHDVNRPAWAAVGGSIGLAVGFSFPVSWQGKAASLPGPTDARRLPITQEEVSASDVRTIHFLDAGAATVRFGAGHGHGAILIASRSGRTGE